MNITVALLLAVGALCNNLSDKEGCTKRVAQCVQNENYIKQSSNSKQEQILNFCSNKELGIKERSNESSNP